MSDSIESSDSQPPDRARSTGAALEAHYRFVVWLVPTLERFPRSQKFLLGDRIQHTALDILERLIEATYTRRRGSHLTLANIGLEKLRFLCRLARDSWNNKPSNLRAANRNTTDNRNNNGFRVARPLDSRNRRLTVPSGE